MVWATMAEGMAVATVDSGRLEDMLGLVAVLMSRHSIECNIVDVRLGGDFNI